jgi:hypothetical protein
MLVAIRAESDRQRAEREKSALAEAGVIVPSRKLFGPDGGPVSQ